MPAFMVMAYSGGFSRPPVDFFFFRHNKFRCCDVFSQGWSTSTENIYRKVMACTGFLDWGLENGET